MKSKISILALVVLLTASIGGISYADTQSYDTLTTAQEQRLNQVGAPSSISDSERVNLGTLLDELIDGFSATPDADSGTTNDAMQIDLTSPADTTGTNTHNALVLDVAVGNATGGTNTVTALQIDAITGDAQVTENAINIGTGYDYALKVAGGFIDASASAATFSELNSTKIGATTAADATFNSVSISDATFTGITAGSGNGTTACLAEPNGAGNGFVLYLSANGTC